MNKMAIITGEIATGPGLGSSSVIINKIRQRCACAAVAPPLFAPAQSALRQPHRACLDELRSNSRQIATQNLAF